MVLTYSSPAADKVLADHQLLDNFYGHLPPEARRTPMRELISTVLSHRTTHADEELAYDRMLEAFGDWPGVLAAPTSDISPRHPYYPLARYPGPAHSGNSAPHSG